MKIVVVCDVLGEENNGTTIAAMNLIRYLKARGHEVRVLCADEDKRSLDGYYVVPKLNLGPINGYVAKAGVTLAKGDAKIIRHALDGADHVHIMMPFPLGSKSAKIAKKMGLPITAGFHMQAENFTAYYKMNDVKLMNHIVYRYIWRALYRYVDAIHYPTEFVKGVFEGQIKKNTRGYVISNGVNEYVKPKDVCRPEEFKGKTVILSTGRYSREKSQDTLIKAIALSSYRYEIQLILAGHGTKEKYYKKLAKKLPIEPIFKFYGREEMVDVLNLCDLYVHPAETELEGIACIEAISVGKMTVVSDSPRAATSGFAIDEKCIFKNRNPRDLARVIDYWIENERERAEYEKRYLESSAHFDQSACMAEMEKMIFEVYNEKSKGKEGNIL